MRKWIEKDTRHLSSGAIQKMQIKTPNITPYLLEKNKRTTTKK